MTRQAASIRPGRIAVQAVQKYGRVVFVTNGTLAPADRVWVRQSGAGRIERENVGFDVGAYREALLTLGREKLAEYEEIVLMNYTLAGPVCSLAAMFTAMDARPELDFWGLTRHYAMQSRRFGGRSARASAIPFYCGAPAAVQQ